MQKLVYIILISCMFPICNVHAVQSGDLYLGLGGGINWSNISNGGYFSKFSKATKLPTDITSSVLKEDWDEILNLLKIEIKKKVEHEGAIKQYAEYVDNVFDEVQKVEKNNLPTDYINVAIDASAYKFASALSTEIQKDNTISSDNKLAIGDAVLDAIKGMPQALKNADVELKTPESVIASPDCFFQTFCPTGFLKDIWRLFFTDEGEPIQKGTDFERNLFFDVTIGYGLSDYLRIELEGSLSRWDLNEIENSDDEDSNNKQSTSATATDKNAEEKLIFNAAHLMFNTYLNLENESNFVPYVGVGAGVTTGGINEFSINSFGVAYQYMLGLDINVLEELILYLGYKYSGAYNFKIDSYQKESTDGKIVEKKKSSKSEGSLRFDYTTRMMGVGVRLLF